MASLVRGDVSFTGDEAAKDDTTDNAGPRAVKAAFRASMGAGNFSKSAMAVDNFRMRGRRNSLSVMEGSSAGRMPWQSMKSLDQFLADAKSDSLKPKALMRDARSWPSCCGPSRSGSRGTRSGALCGPGDQGCGEVTWCGGSVEDMFSEVSSSTRLAKGNTMWSLHAVSVPFNDPSSPCPTPPPPPSAPHIEGGRARSGGLVVKAACWPKPGVADNRLVLGLKLIKGDFRY